MARMPGVKNLVNERADRINRTTSQGPRTRKNFQGIDVQVSTAVPKGCA